MSTTSSSTTHTALPWRLGRKGCVVADAPVPGISGTDHVEYYGGHLIAESILPSNAAFIVEACNAYHRLNGDRISLELQVARLTIDNANAQDELEKVRSNWELAVEAGHDAVRQLEAAKLVQQQLVAALREAIEIIQAIDQADNTCSARIDVSDFQAVLAAAEA